MKSDIKLGSIFGIKVGLHFSWFIIAALLVFSFAGNFRTEFKQAPDAFVLGLAIAAALIFFVSLLLHELSHSLMARAKGLQVREITLFALGGVSQLEGEPKSARDEILIAAVGPLASLVIGGVLLAVAYLLGGAKGGPVVMTLGRLGFINVTLAIFNLIPGYPLDGGRVLRGILWWRGGNLERATRTSARIGQSVGFAFILLGVAVAFTGGGFGGLWIAFIGWFLVQAAGTSYLDASLHKFLEAARVADVMTPDCPSVDGNASVQELVDEQLLRTGRRCFVVVENGLVAGMVTPHELTGLERKLWPFTTLDHVMKPLEQLQTILPGATLDEALMKMGRENVNQLPVVEDGHLLGMLSRSDLVRYVQTLMELKAQEP